VSAKVLALETELLKEFLVAQEVSTRKETQKEKMSASTSVKESMYVLGLVTA
jgi:hypothetical protein